jgi:hypothetical protein
MIYNVHLGIHTWLKFRSNEKHRVHKTTEKHKILWNGYILNLSKKYIAYAI